MTFKPLHDRVVVRRVENDEKTSGGLIIPDSAQEKPAEGEIVSVGTGARDEGGNRIAPGWLRLLSTIAKSAFILSANPLALPTPPTSGEITVIRLGSLKL